MRTQHLDELGVEIGILQPLSPSGREERNPDFAVEICRAMNEWQAAEWSAPEPRLRASICVPAEDADASVREIERLAGRAEFAQVYMQPRLREPLGSRRYWPIYEAAAHHGLPVGLHTGGNIGIPTTPSGWPSSYGENHFAHSVAMQAAIANLVIEGVLERVPDLKIVVVEGGFAWVPAVCEQMDYFWSRLRSEVPHLKRPPSEYVRGNIWFTTQPMDEPERPRDIVDIFEWIGWDRLMFASDYPHWDSDHPRRAFPPLVPKEGLQAILSTNARGVFRLPQ
jgi:predicted TIM-barrel fold metal-dependent hydrolase